MSQLSLNFDEPIIKKQTIKVDVNKIVERLRKSSASLELQASKINTEVNGNWTYRRQSFADAAQRKKDVLLKSARVLNRIAEQWLNNTIDPRLVNIRTASDFKTIYFPRPVENDDGWYAKEYPSYVRAAEKLFITCKKDAEELTELINQLGEHTISEEQQKYIDLNKKIKSLKSANIPGFFPTPESLIEFMLELANINDNDTILEPSAGIGSIVDMIRERYPYTLINCVERVSTLIEILDLKGYNVIENDIFNYFPDDRYDKIIMNPPFEKSEDIDHVLHCFNNCLKVDGTLIAIMSAGTKTNTSNKHKAFRELVDDHGGEFFDNGQAFKNAFNSTGVSTVTLQITKTK